MSGGTGAFESYQTVVNCCCLALFVILILIAFSGMITSFDGGLGDCLASQRSFTNNTVLLANETCGNAGDCIYSALEMECTVDMDKAKTVCEGLKKMELATLYHGELCLLFHIHSLLLY